MSESTQKEITDRNYNDADKTALKWYLLNFKHQSFKAVKEMLENSTIEYFLPSYVSVENGANGKKIRKERALMFNMLFLHSTLKDAVKFVSFHQNINFMSRRVDNEQRPIVGLNRLIDRKEDDLNERLIPKFDDATFRYVVTIPDAQMQMFIKAVAVNETKAAPFIKPSEIDLEKGDKVRIIGGPYDGIEGVLESQKGKDGGIVYVHIQNFIATKTAEIRPEFIQIIEFAKTSKHMYKKFESFMVRGERCVDQILNSKGISARDRDYFTIFINRFEKLQTPTVNMTAKLMLYMFIANSCLGNDNESNKYCSNLIDYLPHVNSFPLKAKCLTYLYACTSEGRYKTMFFNLIKEWSSEIGEDKKQEEAKKLFFEIQMLVESN